MIILPFAGFGNVTHGRKMVQRHDGMGQWERLKHATE